MVLVNAQIERLFGYPREALVGQRIEMLVPERFRARHPEFRAAFLRDPRCRLMGAGRDLYGLRRDGSEVPIEIGLNPVRTPEGRFVLSSVADVSERKRGERERERLVGELRTLNAELEQRVDARTHEIVAALKEREVLLQEVHHRVKNNLQVISSLISMQARSLPKDASREALQECQTRVQAIALIHEKLYQSRDYAQVPFAEYARSLVSTVFEATGVAPDRVSLVLATEDVALAVDKAIPCGLILNELVTNALKHAFPDGRHGTIRVELGQLPDGTLHLEVSDAGVGLPADLDLEQSPSLGLHLVRMLARQLGATLRIEREGGTRFHLDVPAEGR
jgi:PAS domain S-box-containing protein